MLSAATLWRAAGPKSLYRSRSLRIRHDGQLARLRSSASRRHPQTAWWPSPRCCSLMVFTNNVQNVMNKLIFIDNMPSLAAWPGRTHLDRSSAMIVPIELNKLTSGDGTIDVIGLGTSTSWTVRIIPIIYASKVSLKLMFCSKPFRISGFVLHFLALYSEERSGFISKRWGPAGKARTRISGQPTLFRASISWLYPWFRGK